MDSNSKMQERIDFLKADNKTLEEENKRLRTRIDAMINTRVLLEADLKAANSLIDQYREALDRLMWED